MNINYHIYLLLFWNTKHQRRHANQWIIFLFTQRKKEIEASGQNFFLSDNNDLVEVPDLNKKEAGLHFNSWLEKKLEDETPKSISDVKPKFYTTTTLRKFI